MNSTFQPESYRIVEAENWDDYNDSINIFFKLPNDLEIDDRMITMVIYGENKTKDPSVFETDGVTPPREMIPLASYTILNKDAP